ncbi:MAG: polysaccharide deacetylase family protein [Chitinophagaceae bacterium]|nr:polysaccharide deacetylase family protein [Chitinophagaceae bacterium]
MKRFHWPFIVLLLGNTALQAQFNQPWQGKKCAVVITYDDAIDQHLDNALPLLDSLGLKATFYVTAFSPSVQTRMEDWRAMAAKGHELGNHTLYHPCAGGPGREWVPKEYDLSTYTLKQIVDETRMTNLFLQALDGKTERTFAYTCGDQKVEDSFFIEPLKKDFIAARGVRGEMHKIQDIDLYNTDCYMVNHHKAEQMIAWVEEAMRTNSMLVILFHGVGGGNGLDVSLPDHRQFLQYLKDHEKDIYIAPMVEMAKHIRSWQTRDKAMKAIQAQTQKDYQDMIGKLGITSTRPGPSGNPSAPNAANIDESKASPYTTLPDPLKLKNGKTVNNASAWWKKRRPEIVAAFDKEIYGRVPTNTPAVRWEIKSQRDSLFGGTLAEVKELVGHVDNSSYPALTVDIQFSLVLPKHVQQRVPVMIEFGFIFPPGFRPPAPPPGTPVQKSWQEQLLERGWGFGILVPTSYQADNGAGLTEGIIGLCNKGQFRSPDQWGTLRAWAWGASRTIDYLETDPRVDAKRVGIEGLSRYGKAAIVTMAYEPRVSIGFIGSSGAGGTKILRRVYGEQVENLASSAEYHWFAGNFIRYAGPLTPNDLPVDAHQLVALCAPRPVFISSGSPNVEGRWVDAKGMFLGGVHASPVYELLGKKGLGTDQFPEEKTGLLNGDIAWRQHEGGHTTGPNWEYFIQFAGRYW